MQQHVLIHFVIHVGHPHGIDLISGHCRIIWLFFTIWQRKKGWATGSAGIWHLLGLAELSITQSESTPSWKFINLKKKFLKEKLYRSFYKNEMAKYISVPNKSLPRSNGIRWFATLHLKPLPWTSVKEKTDWLYWHLNEECYKILVRKEDKHPNRTNLNNSLYDL